MKETDSLMNWATEITLLVSIRRSFSNFSSDNLLIFLPFSSCAVGRMWDNNKFPVRLILNGEASKEIEWHCKVRRLMELRLVSEVSSTDLSHSPPLSSPRSIALHRTWIDE